MFIPAVKLRIVIWRSMGIVSLMEPASSGRLRNCSFMALPQWLHFSACLKWLIPKCKAIIPGFNLGGINLLGKMFKI